MPLLDGCDMEVEQLVVAGLIRGDIQWVEGTIGMTISSQCPCEMVPVPMSATRVCAGDFVNGGQWLVSNTSECALDNLSFELCSATVSPSYILVDHY